MHRVLVVDDDNAVTEVVKRYLLREEYEVAVTGDGREALRLVNEWGPDLVVLDLKLPSLDGLEVCRRLRQSTQLPIIMLTALGDEADRIVGLEMGADDYVVKPFSPRELVARVKSVLRRTNADPSQNVGVNLRFNGMSINAITRVVTVHGDEVLLTAKEFDLLMYLASHRGHVFTRAQLMDQVWDYNYAADPSTITVHIRRLREKIENNPRRPRFIKTVHGVGYKFDQ